MIVDFHAHILPGADHGSDGPETSLSQLRLIEAAGVDAVVATPHFYPHRDTLDTFLARRAAAAKTLSELAPTGDLRIFLGAEVLVCPRLDQMPGIRDLAIVGTNVILLEMPFRPFAGDLIDTVLSIREMGLTPVLAHIDRYEKESVWRLLRAGIHAQLNASSLKNRRGVRRESEYLEGDAVVALGSDLHGAKPKKYRYFVHSRHLLGEKATEIFSRTTALLKGAEPLQREIEPAREHEALGVR